MHRPRRAVGLIALALSIASWAEGPQPSAIEVAGALPRTGTLTLKDLEGMQPVKASWSHHGKTLQVEGVPVGTALAFSGFEAGAMGKGVSPSQKVPGYKKVLRATAKDGFSAVFSCGELDEKLGATQALLVWKIDGQSLPPDQGPVR